MSIHSRFSKNLDRIRTEPGLGKNVGVVSAVIVLALVAGGWILGNQRFTPPWADRFQLAAAFEATPGIAPGNGQEVRIAGVLAGQITGAHVDRDGHAVVDMELDEGFRVFDNAMLVLRPKSPLNEMYVSIDPGHAPGKELRSGATLPVANTRRPVQVDEVLSSLDDRARGALTALLAESDVALAKAPRQLPGGLDKLSDLTDTARPVVVALDERREHIRDLVTQIGLIANATGANDQRLAHLADSLQSTLGSVSGESDALDAALRELPAFSRTLGSSTASVKELADQLNPTLRDLQAASDTLPDALKSLSGTADELHTTMTKLRPVARNARPVLADLRPVVANYRISLPMLAKSTARLDPVTALLTQYLPDLGAFMVQTRSVASLRDGNAGIMRAMAVLTPTSVPKFPLN